jgi:hypothetical protein
MSLGCCERDEQCALTDLVMSNVNHAHERDVLCYLSLSVSKMPFSFVDFRVQLLIFLKKTIPLRVACSEHSAFLSLNLIVVFPPIQSALSE